MLIPGVMLSIGQHFFLSRKLPNFEIKVLFMFSFKIWKKNMGVSRVTYQIHEKKIVKLNRGVYGKGVKIGLGIPYFGLTFLRFLVGDPPFSFRKSIEHNEKINPTNFQ